jgi:hypothetical protein
MDHVIPTCTDRYDHNGIENAIYRLLESVAERSYAPYICRRDEGGRKQDWDIFGRNCSSPRGFERYIYIHINSVISRDRDPAQERSGWYIIIGWFGECCKQTAPWDVPSLA